MKPTGFITPEIIQWMEEEILEILQGKCALGAKAFSVLSDQGVSEITMFVATDILAQRIKGFIEDDPDVIFEQIN